VVYARSEVKDHGTRSAVEGVHARGDVAVMVDDVATTGGAKLEALEKLRHAGIEVQDVAVLVDLESGAADALGAHGLRLHSVARLSQLLAVWRSQGKISEKQEREVMESR
jgi:orotate phosphoribosyltransferase